MQKSKYKILASLPLFASVLSWAGRQVWLCHRGNKQKGFTLIELLVAITIFALFLTVAGTSLVDVLRLEQKANVLRKTQQNTRYILESIIREARGANGEFYEINDRIERIAPAYEFEPTGSPTEVIITNTDFETKKITRKIYYLDEGVIKKDTFLKLMDGEAGENFSYVSSVSLSDINDLKILRLEFSGSAVWTDLEIPPFLHITIEAESEKGLDFDRPELRAHTLLTSSATPRSY